MTAPHANPQTPYDRLYTCERQPWRSLYTTYQIIFTIFFRLPFWFTIAFFPWGRLHPQFTPKKALIIRITRTILKTAYKYVICLRSLDCGS